MSEINAFEWDEIVTLLTWGKKEWTAKENMIMPGRGIKCKHYEV